MSLPRSKVPVVVLGAGLAGMSAALHLQKRKIGYRIFEKLDWPGGHAITTEDSGYRFDRTGHLLHLRDDEIRRDVLRWIGDDHEVVQRRSVIWSSGTYTRYPFQANTFGLPPEVANECLLGFLEAHYDNPEGEPSNFEEFCLRHFGEGISRHFMIPYNCRLWGVHPREITSAWCQRFVPLPKLEDVVAGAVGLTRELGYNTNFVYPRRGIGVLSEAMASEIPDIELGRRPTKIDHAEKEIHFTDEIVEYDLLVNTIPLNAVVDLLDSPPDAARAAAGRLRCSHLYYLDAALNTPCGKDVHWIYVPEAKYPFYRVGCYSHFSPQMAPPGKASLYIELADREEPDFDRLMHDVTAALTEMSIISKPADLAFARLRKIDYAYVIFDHAYYDSLAVLEPFLEDSGILSVGRYGQWTYCSMEDAMIFGRDAVDRVADLLK